MRLKGTPGQLEDQREQWKAEGRSYSFDYLRGQFTFAVWVGDVPKRWRPRCGAMCRDGHPCQARVVSKPNGLLAKRCRLHGGLSTGPKTAKGRQRIVESNRRRIGKSE
jgi:hypothetical protein